MSLSPRLLLGAYRLGYFPMAHHDGTISWYNPDPRTIIPLDERFHVSRRLARTVRQGRFEIRINHDFLGVIEGCAARPATWISVELIDLYVALHEEGHAHSLECWRAGRLVGGIYGLALQGLFAGESMFSRERDASKVALVQLVARLRARGYRLFDVQFTNPHLRQFGIIELSRAEYERRLVRALTVEARFD